MGGRVKEPFLRVTMGYAAAATGAVATSSWRRVYAAGDEEGTPATRLRWWGLVRTRTRL